MIFQLFLFGAPFFNFEFLGGIKVLADILESIFGIKNSKPNTETHEKLEYKILFKLLQGFSTSDN
jgi:hypothetical protein